MTEVPNPGLRSQPAIRMVLRVVGITATLAGAGLVIMWIIHFSSSVGVYDSVADRASQATSANDVGPIIADAFATTSSVNASSWTLMAGIMLLIVGAWALRVGFLGPATRYVAGETMPVVKDSVAYLTDGEGFMGIGRITNSGQGAARVQAPGLGAHHPGAGTQYPGGGARISPGIFCQRCGTGNDANAHFCDACGQRLVR